MSNVLRVGIIGLGVGERHAQIYNQDKRCEIKAICDLDIKRLKDVGKKMNIKNLEIKAEKIINREDIDLISIASYDEDHYKQICQSIKNNKHIFVEKPICQTSYELSDIFNRLKNYRKNFSSNLVLRTTPRFKKLKENIFNDKMGKVYHIEADYNYGRIEKIVNGWRGKSKNYSIINGGAIHMIDLVTWLLDDTITEVFAYGNKFFTGKTDFKNNDNIISILKFKSGATAKIGANFGCVSPHFHRINLYGTKGTFEQNYFGSGYIYDRKKKYSKKQTPDEYPSKDKGMVITSFISEILDGTDPFIYKDEIYHSMSVCLAIEKSIKLAKPIKII